MATYESDIMGALHPATTASQAGIQMVSKGEAVLDGDQANGDLIKLCKLPANHVPHDFLLETDALEDGAGFTVSVGVLNEAGDDLVASTNFITDDTTVQNGGVKRADVRDGLGLTESDSERIIAAKITSSAGGTANSDAAIGGKLTYYQNP